MLATVLLIAGCRPVANAAGLTPAASPAVSPAPAAAGAPSPRPEPTPRPALAASAIPSPEPSPNALAATQAPSPSPAAAVSPSRTEEQTFFSQALGRTMPYVVYLPPGYDSSPAKRYPVLYMLHGIGGPDTEWEGDGLLAAADRLIAAGTISPMIVVLPEGDQSFWVDQANGGPRYGTYTAKDVVAEIDTHYRTIPDRAHRAVGGLSMGADGALQLAMNFPGVYSVVGAHSPTPHTLDELPPFFGNQAYFQAHNAVDLFRSFPNVARSLQIWLDVAAQDTDWLPRDIALHQQLLAENIPHQWHDQWPGDHGSEYWAAHVEDYLRYYDQALKTAARQAGESP